VSTSTNAGSAATENLKHNDFLNNRFMFIPVAQESTGVWGNEGLAFVKKIGSRIYENTEEKRPTDFLFQRLSINLQRGNLASILGTLPAGKKLEEVFLL